jgi:hypothetical protein
MQAMRDWAMHDPMKNEQIPKQIHSKNQSRVQRCCPLVLIFHESCFGYFQHHFAPNFLQ